MRKRRKMTPDEVAEREAKKARQRRFAELLEQRLKKDAELAAAGEPDEDAPPRLRPMSADEIPTEAARRERTLYFRELMAWRLKRDEELAAARDQPDA
jgi:hypothetical protein